MRDIKLQRKVEAVNDWLFERNTPYRITVKTHEFAYEFMFYQKRTNIGGSVYNKEEFDKNWEESLEKIAFGLLKQGFEYKIEARPVVTPMHDIRSESDAEEFVKSQRKWTEDQLNR